MCEQRKKRIPGGRKILFLLVSLLVLTAFSCRVPEERGSSASSETEMTTERTTETLPDLPTGSEKASEDTTSRDAASSSEKTSESSTEIPTESEGAVTVEEFHSVYVVTGTDSLNIRASFTTEAEVIDGLLRGASGEVTGVTSDGLWYRIERNGVHGFIHASYVTTGEEAEKLIAEASLEESRRAESIAALGRSVCIDAGHQQAGIGEKEPNGPGSSVMKAKLTTGTSGCATGAAEYVINLQVSLKLQQELESRGYTVFMVRTTNDCPMSNAERAEYANSTGAGCFVRVHCNSVTNPEVTGIINYAPSGANPYLSNDVIASSNSLAAKLASSMCAATGAVNRGVLQDDTMTGINWCRIPVAIVEMGFMSNPDEDRLLSDETYQWKLAKGMADGIDEFYAGR